MIYIPMVPRFYISALAQTTDLLCSGLCSCAGKRYADMHCGPKKRWGWEEGEGGGEDEEERQDKRRWKERGGGVCGRGGQ